MSKVSSLSVPDSLLLGPLLVLLAATGFSVKAILVKLAYVYRVDAITLLALRMLFSLPFFLAMAWWSSRQIPVQALKQRDWLLVLFFGLAGYYCASLLDFYGLQTISAGLEPLTLFLNPTFVVLLSALLLGRRITRHDLLAFAICYAGIGLAFWNDLQKGETGEVVLGTALVLASAVSYAVYLVGSGELVRKMGSVRYSAYAMFAATLGVLVQFLLTRAMTDLVQPGPVYVYALAMAVFSTVLPVWMMVEGMRRMGAASASIIGMAGPIITIFMASAFLNEAISAVQLAGAALVLAGVSVISFAKSPRI